MLPMIFLRLRYITVNSRIPLPSYAIEESVYSWTLSHLRQQPWNQGMLRGTSIGKLALEAHINILKFNPSPYNACREFSNRHTHFEIWHVNPYNSLSLSIWDSCSYSLFGWIVLLLYFLTLFLLLVPIANPCKVVVGFGKTLVSYYWGKVHNSKTHLNIFPIQKTSQQATCRIP